MFFPFFPVRVFLFCYLHFSVAFFFLSFFFSLLFKSLLFSPLSSSPFFPFGVHGIFFPLFFLFFPLHVKGIFLLHLFILYISSFFPFFSSSTTEGWTGILSVSLLVVVFFSLSLSFSHSHRPKGNYSHIFSHFTRNIRHSISSFILIFPFFPWY